MLKIKKRELVKIINGYLRKNKIKHHPFEKVRGEYLVRLKDEQDLSQMAFFLLQYSDSIESI